MVFGSSQRAAAVADDFTDQIPVKGRSLLKDAQIRFVQNKAAMASVFVLALIVIFVIVGPLFAQWSNEEIDWDRMGNIASEGAPSIANGHFFGLDELGRDLYSRVIQATRTSLLVGLVGALTALIIGTTYGLVAGYVGGRVDSAMMRFVDILLAIPLTLVLILLLVYAGRSFFMLFV
jgi:oligopeptide transport system permease protein